MRVNLDTSSLDDYQTFLKIKSLPTYRFRGREAEFPDEYASRLGMKSRRRHSSDTETHPASFDYQAGISRIAIRRRKYAVFARMGYGKTLIMFDWTRHAMKQVPSNRCGLIVAPLMVIEQHIEEWNRFYPDDAGRLEQIGAADLQSFLDKGKGKIGITNYESLRDGLTAGRLAVLAADESSFLKGAYGKWAQRLIDIGRGLDWKLALTGTPAPNDRIEYGNHAVLMDQFPNVNSFLARFFVNRGQTNERWELRPHALESFYRSLSHWCIFLNNPSTYGWKDNCKDLPPVHVHIEDVPLTHEQESKIQGFTGGLFATRIGGITSRAALGQIAKGHYKGEEIPTNKPDFIRRMVDSWPTESTIIWCMYNGEQEQIERTFPEAASIDGDTPHEQRVNILRRFKAGAVKTLISKTKVLGYGLNLQVATRHVFSGIADSYESFVQAVARSNRVGSTKPLNVHIPVTDIEREMVDNVLRKAKRVQQDTEYQEQLFKKCGLFEETNE